jgi:hypothetical protein
LEDVDLGRRLILKEVEEIEWGGLDKSSSN